VSQPPRNNIECYYESFRGSKNNLEKGCRSKIYNFKNGYFDADIRNHIEEMVADCSSLVRVELGICLNDIFDKLKKQLWYFNTNQNDGIWNGFHVPTNYSIANGAINEVYYDKKSNTNHKIPFLKSGINVLHIIICLDSGIPIVANYHYKLVVIG